ncbi:hypothetical protein V6N13_103266 [Hibiscus sabdariffa]
MKKKTPILQHKKSKQLSLGLKQSAASKSANPWIKAQYLLDGGVPTVTLTRPSKSTQTPNFNLSLGQYAAALGDGGHGVTWVCMSCRRW